MNYTDCVEYLKDKKKWVAYLICNKKNRKIGEYDSQEEAIFHCRRAEYILGFHTNKEKDISAFNIGKSDYSDFLIQPYHIIKDHQLNYWDGDIVKRVLRTKNEPGMTRAESRLLDYEKIKHICDERIRQIREGVDEELNNIEL